MVYSYGEVHPTYHPFVRFSIWFNLVFVFLLNCLTAFYSYDAICPSNAISSSKCFFNYNFGWHDSIRSAYCIHFSSLTINVIEWNFPRFFALYNAIVQIICFVSKLQTKCSLPMYVLCQCFIRGTYFVAAISPWTSLYYNVLKIIHNLMDIVLLWIAYYLLIRISLKDYLICTVHTTL